MLRKTILVLAIASALVACSKDAKDTAKRAKNRSSCWWRRKTC
jgi:hypothetical protein